MVRLIWSLNKNNVCKPNIHSGLNFLFQLCQIVDPGSASDHIQSTGQKRNVFYSDKDSIFNLERVCKGP